MALENLSTVVLPNGEQRAKRIAYENRSNVREAPGPPGSPGQLQAWRKCCLHARAPRQILFGPITLNFGRASALCAGGGKERGIQGQIFILVAVWRPSDVSRDLVLWRRWAYQQCDPFTTAATTHKPRSSRSPDSVASVLAYSDASKSAVVFLRVLTTPLSFVCQLPTSSGRLVLVSASPFSLAFSCS